MLKNLYFFSIFSGGVDTARLYLHWSCHGSRFHQWGPAGPLGVRELCGDAGMKAAGQTCDRVLNPWFLGFASEGSEPITQADRWSTHREAWGKNSIHAQRIRYPQFQTCDGSYTISFLSEDLFGNRCSFSLSLLRFSHTVWLAGTVISVFYDSSRGQQCVCVKAGSWEMQGRARVETKMNINICSAPSSKADTRGRCVWRAPSANAISSFTTARFTSPSQYESFYIPSESAWISFDPSWWECSEAGVYVWPHQRPVDQDRGPARPGSGLPVLDHSATQWMWGCNSPSVCGLGWCRGWGELGVSHGKAGFIVSLWEWWIWERERDTFLTFKNTLYLQILPNWQVKNIIKDRYYKRLKPGKFYSR